MALVAMNGLGSVDLADLAALYELQGYDFLPYPFLELRPAEQHDASTPVVERFADGDLRIFRDWIAAYPRADLWVECRVVNYLSPDTAGIGILGYRMGESGFFASQRPDRDLVDVSTVSPYELGAAVTASVALSQPGIHPQIDVPGYTKRFAASAQAADPGSVSDVDDDAYEISVRDTSWSTPVEPIGMTMADEDIATLVVIQSRCQPVQAWGPDLDRKLVVCVRIKDDGEYIFAPDFSHATPLTAQMLHKRVDQLIAEDVAVLRQRRGLV